MEEILTALMSTTEVGSDVFSHNCGWSYYILELLNLYTRLHVYIASKNDNKYVFKLPCPRGTSVMSRDVHVPQHRQATLSSCSVGVRGVDSLLDVM